jgi:hypothetical protein
MATCDKDRENVEASSFISFSKNLLKSFVILSVIVLVISLKNRLITKDTTLFYTALFILSATILLSIVSVVDNYVYSNIILGIGLALGLQLMDWRMPN